MALIDIQLSKEDFESSGWQTVIGESERKECHSYSRLLQKKARETKDSGNANKAAVLSILGHVASMMLRPAEVIEPFDPRSANVDDFSHQELVFLAEVASDILDSELRARVGDLLWVRKRDFRFAELAIDAYLESATILEDPEDWPACEDRIQRALRLAVLIGSKTGKFEKVISHIESVLNKYQGEDPLYLSGKLMSLLLEFKQGDSTKYSALSEKLAHRAESRNNWTLAREYWEIKEKWHKKSGSNAEERASRIRAAETYEKEAEAALENNNYLIASSHMQHAIEAHRRIGGQKSKANELHKKLLSIQQNIKTELKMISTEVDISGEIEKAVAKIKGKPIRQSLVSLAFMLSPIDVNSLRSKVQENAKKYIFQHLITQTLVDEDGKVLAQKPSMLSNDPKEVEEATQIAMFEQTQFHRLVYADAIIWPVIREITLEHYVRLNDFDFIVFNNPLIPEGREGIYAKGFLAGLHGDLLVAAHLLIPQLENSLRYVLTQRGIPVSGINSEGIQEEFEINKLLHMKEIEESFGEDITFDLRALLIERFGANLRNRMAHGLIGEGGFGTPDVIYLWWLVLHLCCLPHVIQAQRMSAQRNGPRAGTDTPNPSDQANEDSIPEV